MHSLTFFFDWLIAASFRASVLSIVVLILQSLLRHRIPLRWCYALWLPVLVVLLTPAFPESPWSVGSIVRTSAAPLPVPVVMQQGAAMTATVPVVAASEMPASIPWQQMMRLAWLIGAAGTVVFSFWAFVRTLWRFKGSQVPVSDALLHEVDALAREIGLRRTPRVWMAPEIRSPAVTGLLHPTLLLPANFKEKLTAREAQFVLRHELTHIKRGDLPLNALLCLILALHWFNPLLWLAFFKARIDREAACDAQVLDREPQPQRVAYGHTLLKVESTFSHHGLSLGFVGIFQRGIALRSRIQSIAKQPNPHLLMKTTLSLSIALLTFLGSTKAAPPDKNAPQVLIEAKFIEVNDGATDLLDSFATSAASPSVGGMLNDGQLSALWKKIEQAKGVDVLSTPRVITRSGQEAKIEIVREFAYQDAEGKPASKQLGTTLAVVATKGGENDIDLELSPQIVELEGMIKDAKSGVEQPVFSERKVTTNVSMNSGQTVVLGFPASSTKQTSEDRSAGRVSTKTENVTRRTMVFVTARLVDPATGNAVEAEPAAAKSPLQAKLDAIVIPQVQFQEAKLTDAVEFLRHKSQTLDTSTADPNLKGVNIVVKSGDKASEAKITLDLKDIRLGDALKYVAELASLQLVIEPHGVLLLSKAGSTVPTPEAKVDTKVAAGAVILPNVHFHNATLAQAVEFLRIKSRDLDPEKKGLNILVKPGGNPEVRITLQLKDVPAHEALRYVTQLAGHKLSVDGDVWVISPSEATR